MAERSLYIGIDIDNTYAVAGFYTTGMKEPETLSMVAGSEAFQIPVQITKKKGIGQWFIGTEAERVAEEQQTAAEDSLLVRAMNQEKVLIEQDYYSVEELLVLFLQKLIACVSGMQGIWETAGLAISVEKLDAGLSGLLLRIGNKLGFDRKQITLMDRKTAFCYFALNQQENLWMHDVCLYDYRDGKMHCLRLERNLSTEPQLVTIEEVSAELNEDCMDESFYQLLQMHMKGHIVSSVYLAGNAFEGNWMNLSLAFMCRGRRAFMGKNLYAKGACYAVMADKHILPWRFVYLGDSVIKMNVSLKVRNRGREEFCTLLNAGEHWYDASGSCEVIMNETNEVPIWMQAPNSRQAKVETLTLSDLPEREERTTRLRISAEALSDSEVHITIKDMGFGEIAKSSDMSWDYTIVL